MTPEDLQVRMQELRAAYNANQLPVLTLTLQLYGVYVEVVQHIASGEATDPQRLCRALMHAVAVHFPDRPWVAQGTPGE